MALAKKGSRRITVDGTTYRWTVSPDDGYMVLVVESAESPGQRMEAVLEYHHLLEDPRVGCGPTIGQRSITPDTVRLLIHIALCRGWQPLLRGRTFRIQDADSLVPFQIQRR